MQNIDPQKKKKNATAGIPTVINLPPGAEPTPDVLKSLGITQECVVSDHGMSPKDMKLMEAILTSFLESLAANGSKYAIELTKDIIAREHSADSAVKAVQEQSRAVARLAKMFGEMYKKCEESFKERHKHDPGLN